MNLLFDQPSATTGVLATLLVLIPIVAGAASLGIRGGRGRTWLVFAAAGILAAASVLLAALDLMSPQAPTWQVPSVGGIQPGVVAEVLDAALLAVIVGIAATRRSPWVIALAAVQLAAVVWSVGFGAHGGVSLVRADFLAVALVLIVSLIGPLVVIFAIPYMERHEAEHGVSPTRQPRFFATLLLFLGAMNGLALSDDLRLLHLFWEVTTLCSFLLIGHDRDEVSLANGFRALWMNLLGGAGFLAALLMLSAQAHTTSLMEILALSASGTLPAALLLVPLACLCFAGFTKAAQLPFQGWLLGAMVAPTPVSALLHSSTMVKAGVYLILRLSPAFHHTHLSDMVAVVGSFTFLAAAFLAVGQTNAKRVLAYSTISNLGLIITCAGLNTPLAATAAVLLLIFHAVSKALLFLSVGSVEGRLHSKEIEAMEGLVARMPLIAGLMAVGILSMLIPPFGFLIAKLVAIEASVSLPYILIPVILGSALTLVFWARWIGRMLTGWPTAPHIEKIRPTIEELGPLFALVGGTAVMSVLVIPLVTKVVMPATAQLYGPASAAGATNVDWQGSVLNVPWLPILAVFLFAMALPALYTRWSRASVRPPYICGEQTDEGSGAAFVSTADERAVLVLRGSYYQAVVNENRHAAWMAAVSIALIALVFASAWWQG